MTQYLYESSSYNKLEGFINDFDRKYEYKELLEQQKNFFINVSTRNYYNHTIITYTESLISILKTNLSKISYSIRISLIKHNPHYRHLMKVHREIRCGFNMYKFRSKMKDKHFTLLTGFNRDIKTYTFDFLSHEDRVSFNIARVYSLDKTKKILSKMPIKTMCDSKYFTYFHNNYSADCERILKLGSPRKSWNKNAIINLLVDNDKQIFCNFNKLPVEYIVDISDNEEVNSGINVGLFYFNKSLINTNYANKSFKFHKAIELWETTKLNKKTMKSNKTKKKNKENNHSKTEL